MMKNVILLLFLLSFSLPLLAQSNGIVISYKEGKLKELKKVHQQLGTFIFYQAKKTSQQVIHSKNKMLNQNEDYLRGLCKLYQQEEIITDCQLNTLLKKKDEECVFEGSEQLTELRGLGSFFSELVKTSSSSCSLVNPKKLANSKSNGGSTSLAGGFKAYQLTPLWAQEYIGADLTYQWMKEEKIKDSSLSVKDGVIDTGFNQSDLSNYPLTNSAYQADSSKKDDPRSKERQKESKEHGSAVISLMIHPEYGVSPVAELSLVKEAIWSSSIIEGIDAAIENGTQIINMSTDTPAFALPILEEANKHNLIIVTAAGNEFDDDKKQIDSIYSKYDQIVVGSLAPQGYISEFSQQGKEVSILAPSDYWVQAQAENRRMTFGGTSGASPLVKGALDNVLAFTPELNVSDIKVLLKNTAIKTISTETENNPIYHNGSGMLNAYKLARVAKRLHEELEKTPEESKADKIKELINSSDLYNFKDEARASYQQGTKLLSSSSCEERQKAFSLIRTSYFLDNNEKARLKLIELYLDEGMKVNAEFYKSVAANRKDYINEMSSELFRLHTLHYPKK